MCPNPKPFTIENPHPFHGGKFNDVFEPYYARQVIVVVPPGSEQAYRKAPGWSNFTHIQSTMPSEAELREGERERIIEHVRRRLDRARAEVSRLEAKLDSLSRGN